MSDLIRYESNEGVELVVDQNTGESFATISGYARMVGLSQQAISKRLSKNTDNQIGLKSAEILTSTGLKPTTLIPAKIVGKWLIKDNPTLAEAVIDAGATIYMQRMAGFTKVENPLMAEMIKEFSELSEIQKEIELSEIKFEKLDATKKLVQIKKQLNGVGTFEPIEIYTTTNAKVSKILMDFLKNCQKACEKRGRDFIYSSDLAGASVLKRKDALAMFVRDKKAINQLNKPEILQIFRMLEEANLGTFDAKATTFKPAEKL